MKYFNYYLITINIISFVLFGYDKYMAIKQKSRVRNSILLIISLLGGSIGSLLGMYTFRHKTQTWYYKYGIPFILVIQLFIIFN
jgi:uncharacterized membrane protein YsdA (DUF1294 family)